MFGIGNKTDTQPKLSGKRKVLASVALAATLGTTGVASLNAETVPKTPANIQTEEQVQEGMYEALSSNPLEALSNTTSTTSTTAPEGVSGGVAFEDPDGAGENDSYQVIPGTHEPVVAQDGSSPVPMDGVKLAGGSDVSITRTPEQRDLANG